MNRRAVAAGLLALAGLVLQAGSGAAALAGPPGAAPAAVPAGTGPTGSVPPGAPPDAAPLSSVVSIKLGSLSPAGLTAEDDLVVRGSVRNPGAQIDKATLRLRLHGPVLDTRDEVTSWDQPVTGTPEAGGKALPGGQKLDRIAAGTTIPFTLTVPAGQTGLADVASAFGPRGLTVELAAGGTTLAALRTTVVWSPASATVATRLSMLVPLTSSVPSTDDGAASATNAALLGQGGRLKKVLDASSDVAFDWAIDPAVLQAAARLRETGVSGDRDGVSPTPAGGSSPSGSVTPSGGTDGSAAGGDAATETIQQRQMGDARSWLTQFSSGSEGRVVLGLPYADPDLNSVLDAGESGLLRTSDRLGRQLTRSVLGHDLDRTVAWPGDGKVSGKTVAGLERAHRTDVLIAASSQPPKQTLAYTPTGRSTMRAGAGTLDGLLYDEDLSAQLAGAGGSTSPSTIQTTLAELAVIAMQRPSQSTHVLAVAPRDWNPDPVRVAALTAALHAAPWVSLRNIDTLRTADVDATDRVAPIYNDASRQAEIAPGQEQGIARLNDGLDLFAPIAVDPEPGLTLLREQLVSLLSFSWRQNPENLAPARLEVSKPVLRVNNGVRFLTGSSKLFLAKSAPVAVYVDNKTDFDIRVRIRLTPKSGQLSLTQPGPVRVAAGRRQTVLIKARALAEGDVRIEARLITSALPPQQLGTTSVFTVRVRPDWETRGMIGAAVVLGLLLVIGLLRGIRRDRTRVPPESVPDVDDIATANEPAPKRPAGPVLTGDPRQDGDPTPFVTHAAATKENR